MATLINKSVIPKFEQFIIPPPLSANADDWYLNDISQSAWNITNETQTIIGYERNSPYLLKASKGNGVQNAFFARGNITAIRHRVYFSDDIHVPNKIVHTGDTNTHMEFDADTWTLTTGDETRISVNNTRTYIPGYVRIDGGMEIATNEDTDSPELTFKRYATTNAGGTDDIGHIRVGDSTMQFTLNNDSDGDSRTFTFKGVVDGSEVGGIVNAATVQASTVEIGSKVSLTESSDRADLLEITGTTSGYAGIQIRNSSNEG